MSALHWISECSSAPNPGMVHGLPKLCLRDNLQKACLVMSSCIPNYTMCSVLKKNSQKISSRCSIEILPSQTLLNTEKPTPTPCISMLSQPATCIIQLWATNDPIRAARSLSACDRICTEISCWATGGALDTSSNSLWNWQPSAPEGIRNMTGKQFES